jgi:hypothetical protein
MFCLSGLIFGGTKRVGSRFQVLRSRTPIRRYRGRRVLFSCFARPESFSADRGRFHVLRSRTHFRRYRGRRDPFSCFVLPDSFSAVPWASLPDFMFSAPRHVFGGTEGVGYLFQVLRSRTHFRLYRGRRVPFCVPGLIFDGTEGVVSRFLVLRARTLFQHFRGRRFTFSCFACPYSFSAVPRTSSPVFLFCAPKLVFGGTKGVGSRFHVLRARTHFRRCRARRVLFSCFALLNSFSVVPWASGPVFTFYVPGLVFGRTGFSGPFFMFCAPRFFFGCTECIGCRFHVLRTRTLFRRYRGHRGPFSCFALPNSFLAVPRVSGPVFMFCATELIFGGTEGV